MVGPSAGAGHDDPDSQVRQHIGHSDDPRIKKLGFIDGHHFYAFPHGFGNLNRAGYGRGLRLLSVVGTDAEEATIPGHMGGT